MEPKHLISPAIRLGKIHLLYRWGRFVVRAALSGDLGAVCDFCDASCRLVVYSVKDVKKSVCCNICGWQGAGFYPILGPGYYEKSTVCPRCLCQDRHRSLVHVLNERTNFFSPDKDVIEVAPMRSFQQYCLERKSGRGYLSFDYERFAMEKGDLTRMRYPSESCDYFLAFHVLEHIMEQGKAIAEIQRVLRPSGMAILQVPIDWSLGQTVEYGNPNPRETGHVRRYGRDFPTKLESWGFAVEAVMAGSSCDEQTSRRNGFCPEPIYFATKPGA